MINWSLLLMFQMELGSVAMSPPYQDDKEELFPDLLSTMQTLENDISSMLSDAVDEDPKLSAFPKEVNVEVDEEDEEVVLLKKLFKEQKRKEHPTYPSSTPVCELLKQQRATSPSSRVSSSSPEMVVLMPDTNGREKEYRGPNRNAIMAKLNRERKKKHVSELEVMVKDLSKENNELKADRCILKSRVTDLETEVEYLKGVLANQSELSTLLKNVKATSLSFHSSMSVDATIRQNSSTPDKKKRSHSDTTDGPAKPKARKLVKVTNPVCLETIRSPSQRQSTRCVRSSTQQKSALYEDAMREKASSIPKGVCLHVRDKKVSLEFCKSCSTKAEAAFKKDNDDE